MANSSITIGFPVATQGQMVAATSNTAAVTPGNAQYHPGVAKWWVYFTTNNTPMNATYGVSSVTNIATGRSTINFSVPYTSANYIAVATTYITGSTVECPRVAFNGTPTTSSIDIRTGTNINDVATNYPVYAIGFGNQ